MYEVCAKGALDAVLDRPMGKRGGHAEREFMKSWCTWYLFILYKMQIDTFPDISQTVVLMLPAARPTKGKRGGHSERELIEDLILVFGKLRVANSYFTRHSTDCRFDAAHRTGRQTNQ